MSAFPFCWKIGFNDATNQSPNIRTAPLEGLEGLLSDALHSQLSELSDALGLLMGVWVHGTGSRCVCEAVDHLVDGLRMDQRWDLTATTLNAFRSLPLGSSTWV